MAVVRSYSAITGQLGPIAQWRFDEAGGGTAIDRADGLDGTYHGSVSFGQSGPMRDQAGFGAIGESMGGLRYVTGFPDRPPVRPNLSIGDAIAALHGVIGAMMALHHRNANGGHGQIIDVALYEAVFNMMEGTLPEYDMAGVVRERTGSNLTGIVPSNTYLSRDEVHIVIGANGDSIFKRLMTLIGRDDLGNDSSLADNAGRAKRADELDRVIGEWTATLDADEAVRLLNGVQFLAREMIRQVRLPDGTALKVPAVVPKLTGTPGDVGWVGPKLGEHSDEILGRIGYSPADIAGLRERKVV